MRRIGLAVVLIILNLTLAPLVVEAQQEAKVVRMPSMHYGTHMDEIARLLCRQVLPYPLSRHG
jgi:hypothetical protein